MLVLTLILRRLGAGIAVILLVHLATFIALRLMPGDPWADVAGDRTLPTAAVERLKQIYGQGSEHSIFMQYTQDLGHKLSGDFGASLKIARGHDVLSLLAHAAPVSLTIGCGALLVCGLVCGRHDGNRNGLMGACVRGRRLGLVRRILLSHHYC